MNYTCTDMIKKDTPRVLMLHNIAEHVYRASWISLTDTRGRRHTDPPRFHENTGCVRILRDSKESFRDANAAAHRCSKTPSRDASTLAEKQVAAPFRPEEVVSDGGVVGEKPPSSRSSPGRGKVAGALGLKEFMHRTKVLDLYRGILKVRINTIQ